MLELKDLIIVGSILASGLVFIVRLENRTNLLASKFRTLGLDITLRIQKETEIMFNKIVELEKRVEKVETKTESHEIIVKTLTGKLK